MTPVLAWTLFALGALHLVFGLIKFRTPLQRAWRAGFVGQFKAPEAYAAFWFLMSGPPLLLAGHLAVRALRAGDLELLSLVGTYTLVPALAGVLAFPRSPLWAPLVLSLLLLASGKGWIA